MSGYQEEKNLPARHPSYADYNPHWDYLNQRDGANNRRGAVTYNAPGAQGPMSWNPMQIPQGNLFYNSHVDRSQMMPAHAHSGADINRYSQWNNTKQARDAPSIQNAHTRQVHPHKMLHQDIKSHTHSNLSTKGQDFNIGLVQEFGKIRTNPHELIHRQVTEYQASPHRPPPPLPSHLKPVLGNPLSHLQLLVKNQDEVENPTRVYQQESVDLSAHADSAKVSSQLGENDKSLEMDKPVELVAKTQKDVEEKPDMHLDETDCKDVDKVANNEEENNVEDLSDNLTDIRTKVKENNVPDVCEVKTSDICDEQNKTETMNPIDTVEEVQSISNNSVEEENGTKQETLTEVKQEEEDKKKEEQTEPEIEKIFEETEDLTFKEDVQIIEKQTPPLNAKKNQKRKQARNSRRSSTNSTSPEMFSSKKKKPSSNVFTKNKESHKKKRSNELMDMLRKGGGPVVRIEGSRDNPVSVTVVNMPKFEDEDEKDRLSSKKNQNSASKIRISHHGDPNYKGRARNGLFSSTLSSRYDAHSTDQTWICVFCKKGPHYRTTGDLFGPYVITKDDAQSDSICDFSGDERDITDAQKRGGRNKRSLRTNNMVEHFQKMSKKLKRSQSSDVGIYTNGMTMLNCKTNDDMVMRFEVWVHEECAIWSGGVYLISNRLIGLEEAIWAAVRTMCSRCGEMGANIGCVRRNCANRAHHTCAQESGWYLNSETLIATCQVHRSRT